MNVKDGRQAIINFRASYCNPEVWQDRARRSLEALLGTKWSDNGVITLSAHASTHRNLFQQIQEANKTVPQISVPSDYDCVGYFINSIMSNNVRLNGRIDNVENDPVKRSNFDQAVAHITPKDPVPSKPKGKKSALLAKVNAHI